MGNAIEDDGSLVWLTDQSRTGDAVKTLEANETEIGAGQIFSGETLKLLFNDPLNDPRTPDMIVVPNIGVVYTGGKKKISEHGGFAHDDTNVLLLLSNPNFEPRTITSSVETIQVAPTILKALGYDPRSFQAVQKEGTRVLPELPRFVSGQ